MHKLDSNFFKHQWDFYDSVKPQFDSKILIKIHRILRVNLETKLDYNLGMLITYQLSEDNV